MPRKSFPQAQLERLRREAKKLSRELSITHSAALDRIAASYGVSNWSVLVKHSRPDAPGDASSPTGGPPSPSQPAGAFRHCLHGDNLVDDPSRCYCARCDHFVPLAHLVPARYHADGRYGERFLSQLGRWSQSTSRHGTQGYRSEGAPNILEEGARAAREAREASRSAFHRWLAAQRYRDDPIGDLSGDVMRDERFPVSASSLSELEAYLARHGPHVRRALRQAWREFESKVG